MKLFDTFKKWIGTGIYPATSRPGYGGGCVIKEPFTGAWQRNMEEGVETLVCYPTLYACLMRIATDIGKLPFIMRRLDDDGIWNTEGQVPNVLLKPNLYQTAQQFRENWIISKLMHGNTYVLKERNRTGTVVGLYILDPCGVMPCVSDSGEVYYQLHHTRLVNVEIPRLDDGRLLIPASEIIHDRCITIHNPLIGLPPICAAYWAALKNMKILRSSTEFFDNKAQPGGILTSPAGLSDEDAKAIRDFWNENYTGRNAGKVAVVGADMKYTSFAQNSADSQMVEQMRYSDQQICQPFGIPPYKVGIGNPPSGMSVDDMNLLYNIDALQTHIESIEALLNEGLNINMPRAIALDEEPLLRMDTKRRADVLTALTRGGIAAPNEARLRFNLRPLEGGDTVYMQQQDYPLDQVANNKIEISQPEVVVEQIEVDDNDSQENDAENQERMLLLALNKRLDMRLAA